MAAVNVKKGLLIFSPHFSGRPDQTVSGAVANLPRRRNASAIDKWWLARCAVPSS